MVRTLPVLRFSILAMAVLIAGCDTTIPTDPDIQLLDSPPPGDEDTDALIEELKQTARVLDVRTLATAGLSEFGIVGYVEAMTLIRPIPYVATITHEIAWEYAQDGPARRSMRTDRGFLNIPRVALTTRFDIPLDCSVVKNSGYVSASTTHSVSWEFSVMGIPVGIHPMPRTSSDREDCRVVKYKDETIGSGSEDEEEPLGGVQYCRVRIWYYQDTGEIVDVKVLYCY